MRTYKKESYSNYDKVIYDADMSTYIGNFRNDKRNGYGKLFHSDGSLIKAGEWIDNICIREMTIEEIDEILFG